MYSLKHYTNFFLQEQRAREVERELQSAMISYIKLECPSCDELIFQGQGGGGGGGGGVFICRDNPHVPTYRVCLEQNNSPLVPLFIEQWVSFFVMNNRYYVSIELQWVSLFTMNNWLQMNELHFEQCLDDICEFIIVIAYKINAIVK